MDRQDRPFVFLNSHCCDNRGDNACRQDCTAAGAFNRRLASKARRSAGRRDIREALRNLD